MASRSATVLVIFVIAIIAFCLASVCGAMTGPISIFPDNGDTVSVLDNLSAITDGTGDTGISYDDESQDYSSSSSSNVETTTDSSSSSSSDDASAGDGSDSQDPNVETTIEGVGTTNP